MAQAQTERFRRNLEFLCAEHGQVQAIADKAGVSRVYVSRIIHGRSVPSIDIAARIADAVGIPLADLLEKSSKKLLVAS